MPLEGQMSFVDLDSTVDERDEPRLRTQHAEILERLRAGPATNNELCRIAQRFGARLKELRDAGHKIAKQRMENGVFLYTLEQ